VTDGVHNTGGRIILQLWHVGRVSDPIYLNGALPVAPSAIAPDGHVSMIRPQKSFVTPRALELAEIPGLSKSTEEGLKLRLPPVLTESSCTVPMVTCSTNSFRT
jgi:2,4-dienoyl-CoA reductase-like NADH-dependent reductase (Old Yellow Enzyme family)